MKVLPCVGCGNEYLYMTDAQFKEACDADKVREARYLARNPEALKKLRASQRERRRKER